MGETIDQIRQQNLRHLCRAAKNAGMTYRELFGRLGTNPSSKAALDGSRGVQSPKTIGNTLARKWEENLGFPYAWMDAKHTYQEVVGWLSGDPPKPRKDKFAAVAATMKALPSPVSDALIRLVHMMAAEMEEPTATRPSRVDFKVDFEADVAVEQEEYVELASRNPVVYIEIFKDILFGMSYKLAAKTHKVSVEDAKEAVGVVLDAIGDETDPHNLKRIRAKKDKLLTKLVEFSKGGTDGGHCSVSREI